MKKLILIIVPLLLVMDSLAQINIGGEPISFTEKLPQMRQQLKVESMPSLDMKKIQKEDEEDKRAGVPPRFGYSIEVNYNLENSGTWIDLGEKGRVWQFSIQAKGAKSINLLYDDFWLPEGATLYIFNSDKSHVIGGFTSANNKGIKEEFSKFATGLVYGDEITLEYFEPKEVEGEGEVSIARVVHGYKTIDLGSFENESLGRSGECQVNVNCMPEGNNWQVEKNSVALILVDGNRWCSGSLLVNTSGELLPYFLTADHCLEGWAVDGSLDAINNPDAGDWSFYWNYESPNCSNPNSDSDIPFSSTSGAVVIANNSSTDFALLRLLEDPRELLKNNDDIALTYNGWDARGNPGRGGVGIHHPAGDIKKISTHNRIPESNGNYWDLFWSQTPNGFSVTEGGSSGSPLYDNNHRLIGQLYGGSSLNCSDPANDLGKYGKFSVSWNGNGNSNRYRSLSRWLNPVCNNAYYIGGDVDFEIPIYQATGNIASKQIIRAGILVHYQSGESVNLIPGFWAGAGSEFKAKIGACGTLSDDIKNPNINVGSYVLPIYSKPSSGAPNHEELAANDFDQTKTVSDRKNDLSSRMNQKFFTIKPNPFYNQFTVEVNAKANKKVKVLLTNAVGKVMKQLDYQMVEGFNQITMDRMSDFPSGVYFLSIRGEGVQETHKLMHLNN